MILKKSKNWGPIPSPPLGHSWESLMSEALKIARADINEVPVGALIVNSQGEILAKAHNKMLSTNDPTAHAEIVAIREACQKVKNYRLNNCFIVVSLEPCLMCVGAILQARLTGIVFGAEEQKYGAVVSNIEALAYNLEFPQIWHLGSVLAEQSIELLQDFFQNKRL